MVIGKIIFVNPELKYCEMWLDARFGQILDCGTFLMNLFILFLPPTRYSPDTNLGLLLKPAGCLFYRFGCHIGWQRSYPLLAS